ncbi:MAG: TAXI family TRAP transporter solute-binding subunit [Alphaproteobacteria bacterium]|nr:TAXI family TRAP transporter solute-binding subunit [Alphaproteobacteria bacterium]
MRKFVIRAATTAAFAIATLTATTASAQDQFVRIGGGLAGTYPLFAAKLAELINDNIPGYRAQVVSGNTEATQIQMEQGELEFNISYTYVTKQIFDGKASLGVPTPSIRHVITLYSSVLQPIVPADSDITDLSQLANDANRVWMGAPNGFFYQLAEPTLEAAGVTVEEIRNAGGVIESYGYIDTIQAFQDGRLDATFMAGPVPYGLMMQLQDTPGFKVIGMSDEAMEKLGQALPGIIPGTIPAGSYTGQDNDIQVPYFVNQLVTTANVPDDLVYAVTKLMYEQPEAFHGLFAGSEEIDSVDPLALNGIPVHPAAERFYKEVGEM